MTMDLILASASPRRQQLLREAGYSLTIVPAEIDERRRRGEAPADLALRLARAKAAAVAERHPAGIVLGADTIVVLGDRVLGKPESMAQAREMLRALGGREHRVLTGVALLRLRPPQAASWVCTTAVVFRPLDKALVDRYTRLVNPLDKAGAYGIQEHGDLLVRRVSGLVSNVIGLPVEEVREKLILFDGWCRYRNPTERGWQNLGSGVS